MPRTTSKLLQRRAPERKVTARKMKERFAGLDGLPAPPPPLPLPLVSESLKKAVAGMLPHIPSYPKVPGWPPTSMLHSKAFDGASALVAGVLSMIDTSLFPIPFLVKGVENDWLDHVVRVHVVMRVSERNAPPQKRDPMHHISVNHTFSIPLDKSAPRDEQIRRIVKHFYNQLRVLVDHELAESFLFDGIRVYDPHEYPYA